MAKLKLISDWNHELTEDEYAALTKEGNAYYSFDGVTLIGDNPGGDGHNVNIGIYQVNNVVYAFAASDGVEFENTQSIQVDGETQIATLIASGTGELIGEDKNTVKNIQIILKGDDSAGTFKKLGFSGENIFKITGSDKADTIYVIGGEGKSLPNAELALGQGGDNVIFTDSSTITSINSAGGG